MKILRHIGAAIDENIRRQLPQHRVNLRVLPTEPAVIKPHEWTRMTFTNDDKTVAVLWDELCAKYYEGARQAAALQSTWQSLAGKIDSRRHKEVAERLVIQVTDSAKWRDQILEYFGRLSKKPAPQSI